MRFTLFLGFFLLSACATRLIKKEGVLPAIEPISVLSVEVEALPDSVKTVAETPIEPPKSVDIMVGAARFDVYLPQIEAKRVGIIVNATSMVSDVHLLDTLRSLGVNVVKIFAPEHGFRGIADAGEHVKSGFDVATGVPIVSLYGSHRKPTPEDLADIDLIIYDIQDVGARFYTYISTMTLAMEACTENQKPIIVLDRPNPNGHYVDGPVLKPAYKSFVGMHAVPVVYGMTAAEYAQMICGEHWFPNSEKCQLSVVSCDNYTHATRYVLPVRPSPNLPNSLAIAWYPSLCFFEGTPISVGRGTDTPFQVFGAPELTYGDTYFTPTSREGAKTPPHQGQRCLGFAVNAVERVNQVDIHYLLTAYAAYPDKAKFFNADHFFDKLAGSDELRKQLETGATEAEIRASWQPDLQQFIGIRAKYLLYK